MAESRYFLAGRALGLVVRLWRRSVRIEHRNREVLRPPFVMALWHGRVLGSVMDNIDCGAVTMSSISKDGDLGAGIVEGLGMHSMRGSSTRRGREALHDMEAAIKAGAPFAALTVDGPKGPWREVKPGVLVLARRLHVPIIPVSNSCTRPIVLGTWDRMVLPRPFSRVVVRYGEPIPAAELRGEGAAERVAARLDALTRDLDREILGRDLWPPR